MAQKIRTDTKETVRTDERNIAFDNPVLRHEIAAGRFITPRLRAGHGAYSPAKLAHRWDCCRQTIYNMIHDGQLHSFKVRNSRLIPLSEVERIERGDA